MTTFIIPSLEEMNFSSVNQKLLATAKLNFKHPFSSISMNVENYVHIWTPSSYRARFYHPTGIGSPTE